MLSVDSTTTAETVTTNNHYLTSPKTDLLRVRDCYGILGTCGTPSTTGSVDIIDPDFTSTYTFPDLPKDPDGWDNLDTLWYEPDDGYTHVKPKITVTGMTSDGFELSVQWEHPVTEALCDSGGSDTCAGSDDPRAYGVVQVPFLMFGPEVYARDFTRSSAEKTVDFGFDRSGSIRSHKIGQYPGSMYAPSMTVRGLVPAGGTLEALPTAWPHYTLSPDHLIAIGQSTEHAIRFADAWTRIWQAAQPILLEPLEQSDLPAMLTDTEPSLSVGETQVPLREYVMGISTLFPAVEYRFGTEFKLNRRALTVPGGGGKRVYFWTVTIDPNPMEAGRACDGERDPNAPRERPCPGMIRCGETRTMRIVVRFYRPQKEYSDHNFSNPVHRGHFLNLFREYRRSFKQRYGKVQYTKDPRPFKRVDGGTAGAGGGACNSLCSLYGFAGNNGLNPSSCNAANGTGFNGNNFASVENPAGSVRVELLR